ncbi:MAG: DUF6768 family protein [Pseudomonadota bacterium]
MTEKDISKLDKMIEDALSDQDREIFEETQELGFFALGLSQFGGKLGWVTWVLMVVQTLMFAGAVWCGVHFFGATDVLAAVKWGISGAVLALMAIQAKLSLAPQMQADRVMREIKRVELMLAARQG